MSTTFFSDLLRVALLGTYGGIWMDASIFLSTQLPSHILNAEFFAFQRSIMPPKDAKIWTKFNGGYFVWDEEFRVRLFSAFLRSTPKHPIILALSDILLSYWERETRLVHYYALHIIFDLLIKTPKFASLNCEITNDTDIHLLLLHQTSLLMRLCGHKSHAKALSTS